MLDQGGEEGQRRHWLAALVVLALSWVLPAPAFAAPATPASVQIWYRGSAGCPDGAAFLGLLQRLGRSASVAGVGDRVDFVVTLSDTEQQSSGRLERQSSAGTVAIRDFSSASCDEVAEVLALSLDLTLQPAADAPAASTTSGSDSAEWRARLGAQASVEAGMAHALLLGPALFVGVGSAQAGGDARLSLRGAYGEQDAVLRLRVGLLAARFEGCWSWMLAKVALGPCGGAELGMVMAETSGDGGRTDRGPWASAVAHVRASSQLSEVVSIEAQVGLLLPFVRYDFKALTGGTVADSAALELSAAVGVSFRL